MKAVLVFEVPNDIDISKMRIGGDGNIYYIRDGERASIFGNIKNIKPLPPKLDANDWHRMFSGKYDIREAKGYGWNACLDVITGETE